MLISAAFGPKENNSLYKLPDTCSICFWGIMRHPERNHLLIRLLQLLLYLIYIQPIWPSADKKKGTLFVPNGYKHTAFLGSIKLELKGMMQWITLQDKLYAPSKTKWRKKWDVQPSNKSLIKWSWVESVYFLQKCLTIWRIHIHFRYGFLLKLVFTT